MKRIILIISSIAALSAAVVYISLRSGPVPQATPEPEDKLVAVVNGQPISMSAFQEKYRRFTQRFQLPERENPSANIELKMSFLNKLIETELLLQEAEMRALSVSEEELDREIERLKQDYPRETLNEALERIGLRLEEWKSDRKEKLLIDKLIKREVDSIIHVSDDEVQEYYDNNTDQFKQPLMVRARQIVVNTEEEADELRSRLLKGEDFSELAKRYSLSPDAEMGGDLGVFAKGQMPEEFDEVVFRYRVGSITKVVKSPYGYHIFRVEDRIRPRTRSLDEVREQIAAGIFQKRQEAFFKEWLDSIKRLAKITIYPENLGEII